MRDALCCAGYLIEITHVCTPLTRSPHVLTGLSMYGQRATCVLLQRIEAGSEAVYEINSYATSSGRKVANNKITSKNDDSSLSIPKWMPYHMVTWQ